MDGVFRVTREVRVYAIPAAKAAFGPPIAFSPQPSDQPISGLDWLANSQSPKGNWVANEGRYPTAMTALAGTALLAEGSTTTQGRYAPHIRRAVDYLILQSRRNGLIGDPDRDDRYTYGHGYSMLFLSQVLGEEEDIDRREELVDVLTRAVEFTGEAQTEAGGYLGNLQQHCFHVVSFLGVDMTSSARGPAWTRFDQRR